MDHFLDSRAKIHQIFALISFWKLKTPESHSDIHWPFQKTMICHMHILPIQLDFSIFPPTRLFGLHAYLAALGKTIFLHMPRPSDWLSIWRVPARQPKCRNLRWQHNLKNSWIQNWWLDPMNTNSSPNVCDLIYNKL